MNAPPQAPDENALIVNNYHLAPVVKSTRETINGKNCIVYDKVKADYWAGHGSWVNRVYHKTNHRTFSVRREGDNGHKIELYAAFST
jgi:hypothetical protein